MRFGSKSLLALGLAGAIGLHGLYNFTTTGMGVMHLHDAIEHSHASNETTDMPGAGAAIKKALEAANEGIDAYYDGADYTNVELEED